MKNKIFNLLVLMFFIIFSIFIFFYKLDSIPSGFYVDEAVTGYNSYSILLTGKDQYNKPFPILFKFFGSFSPPLYTYLTVIPIEIWGLSVWSTRFVSAFCGIISVAVCYFYLKLLNINSKKKDVIFLTFLWVISPWVVFFSRIGYEIFLGYLLFSLGALFIYLGIKRQPVLPIGFIFLSLSTYGAHTERFLVPIFILGLFFFFRRVLLPISKDIIISFILFLLIQIPHLSIITTPAFLVKGNLFYSDLVNGPMSLLKEFLSRYLTYLSPKSLFFLGDPMPQRGIPILSVFYSWMVIPYLFGLYEIFKKFKTLSYKYILFLLLISPIPAALTRDPFTSQRAIVVFLPVFLIISLGIIKINHNFDKASKLLVYILLGIYSLTMLFRSYYVLFPQERAVEWNYGYMELMTELQKYKDERMLVDQTRLKPIFIHYLFVNKYPPQKLHEQLPTDTRDYYYDPLFSNSPELENIRFDAINWERDEKISQILIGDKYSFSGNQIREHKLTPLFIINDPGGEAVFYAYHTNPSSN